ncbi:MAG: COG1361 S-layer family protein [Methanosarcina flavescens]|uniref:Alpha-galactosidase NEW3 domain-containing protein n=1 Tax=Methanosarcina flavescens TaxID=1715806 RepID=A0A660HWR9_9EURY|nr:COG1361 S-layer family protein [Methanosarcina flavescens]AYK16476.1 hypothetical protein AOB57_013655 [Methanosarcina flavescens]NLK32243.1 hypothetical protein [Methanosarcina flavescens]
MKNFSLLTLLIIYSSVLVLGAGTTFAASGLIDSSSVQANVTNQNPDAARPGEPVELTISLQNIGSNDLKNINVAIEPQYPFSKVSGEPLEKEVSYLNARQEDNDAAVLKFKLMTDSNASEGTYDLNIVTTAREDGSSSKSVKTTKTIQLEVRGKEYAQIVTINTANIDLAKEEPLEFIITNTGSSPLKNMVISWKDPKGVILPVYSDNTKYVKYLEPEDSVTVAYSVMADVNANPGLYTLDVNLSFEDYESNAKSIQTTAGLFVGGETDFDVSFSESDQGEISLSVANVGNNMAYSVKVSVPEQEGFRVTGSSSSIVGNLEKGDYTIASFNVASAQATDEGESPGIAKARGDAVEDNESSASTASPPLKVQIEYTDAKGERITVDKAVAVQMSAPEGTATETGPRARSSSLGSYTPYFVLILVAVTGLFIYREKKQAKGEKKSRNKGIGDQKYDSGTTRD